MQISEGNTELPAKALYAYLRQIKVISLIHNLLLPETDFSTVDMAEVLRQLVGLLNTSRVDALHNLPIRLQADFLVVHVKVATSLALIVNELVEYTLSQSEVAARDSGEPLPPSPVSFQQSSQESSQESESVNAILIQLRHDSAKTLLTVENPGPGFAPDFDVYDSQELGLELVASLVASDLQGRLTFGRTADERNGNLGEQPRGRVEILFPEQPDAA